jgi:2-polyprenyl-3-methyl-5-hydroxy-6-metoxy-1,4-benzoquinol methylase
MGLYDIMNEGSSIYVKCDLCGQNEPEKFLKKDAFNIVKCKNCGLVYVNPRLKSEELSDLYNKNVISPYHYYLETKSEDEKTFRERLNLIERHAKKGKLLDVGCSIGTFSNVAKLRGWEVYGLDINKQSVDYCKINLQLDVKAGDFEDLDYPKEFFDVVIMNDFLEHVGSPSNALIKANSIMKKKGVIFIVTPKIDSIMAKLSKGKWLHLKPNEHIYYFSTKTMEQLLKKTGFEIISIKPIGRHRNLNTILQKTGTYNKSIYKIFEKLVNNETVKNWSIKLNLRDEMVALAQKV